MILYCYNTTDKQDYLRKTLILPLIYGTKLQVVSKKLSGEDKIKLELKSWTWR